MCVWYVHFTNMFIHIFWRYVDMFTMQVYNIYCKYIMYILYITYVNLKPEPQMYISHLLHASFILGTGGTAMTILVCDQWQKYKLMWKDGEQLPFWTTWPWKVPLKRWHWNKIQQRGTCVPRLSLRPMIQPESGAGRKPWGVSGWSNIVEQGGSMAGAQRGRGETGTQLWGAIIEFLRTWAFLWMRRKTSGGRWNLIVVVVALILS